MTTSKLSDELFPCVYLNAYSYLPDCHPCNSFTPSHPCNSFTPRTLTPSLQLVSYCLSSHTSCVPQQLNSRQNGKFHGHHIEFLLGSLVLSSVHSTIIITNAFINQAGSYYVITIVYFIWDRSQLYPII